MFIYKNKVKLIYNPSAGGGKILKELDNIFSLYQHYGLYIDVYRISTNKIDKHIFDNANEYNHYLIAGGDGTINSFINLMKKENKNVTIAILPVGTANDFANVIKMPKNIVECCEKILTSKAVSIDVGKINEDYFINIASIGIFSNISQTTDRKMIKVVGKVAYILNGIKEVAKLKKMKIILKSDANTVIMDIASLLVFNGKTAGNFELAYDAKIDDGYFDIIIFKPDFLLKAPEISRILSKKDYLNKKMDMLEYFKAKQINIVGIEDYITDIDGERGPKLPVEIHCIHKGIKILGATI